MKLAFLNMVAYYEKQTDFPPTHLLPLLALTLGLSSDQLLGISSIKLPPHNGDSRLWRRFSQVDKLPPHDRNQICQILDACLELHKLKKLKSA